MPIVRPPIEPDLPGLVERADDQSDANRQQLDFGKRDLDVAAHKESLVEHTIEDFNQSGRLRSRAIGMYGHVRWLPCAATTAPESGRPCESGLVEDTASPGTHRIRGVRCARARH